MEDLLWEEDQIIFYNKFYIYVAVYICTTF